MSEARQIRFPTEEEQRAEMARLLGEQRQHRILRRQAITDAQPALARLVEVMRGRSGQCYKLRALLYSLWNGQATPLIEITGLDFKLRRDLCAVLLAFGYSEELGCSKSRTEFFYDAVQKELQRVGQFQWFLEAHQPEGEQ